MKEGGSGGGVERRGEGGGGRERERLRRAGAVGTRAGLDREPPGPAQYPARGSTGRVSDGRSNLRGRANPGPKARPAAGLRRGGGGSPASAARPGTGRSTAAAPPRAQCVSGDCRAPPLMQWRAMRLQRPPARGATPVPAAVRSRRKLPPCSPAVTCRDLPWSASATMSPPPAIWGLRGGGSGGAQGYGVLRGGGGGRTDAGGRGQGYGWEGRRATGFFGAAPRRRARRLFFLGLTGGAGPARWSPSRCRLLERFILDLTREKVGRCAWGAGRGEGGERREVQN
jgi:hypothetical protein